MSRRRVLSAHRYQSGKYTQGSSGETGRRTRLNFPPNASGVIRLDRDPVKHQPAASIKEIELADRNRRREFVGVQLLLVCVAHGNAGHAENGANRHEQAEEAHRKGETGADRDIREIGCLRAQQADQENVVPGKHVRPLGFTAIAQEYEGDIRTWPVRGAKGSAANMLRAVTGPKDTRWGRQRAGRALSLAPPAQCVLAVSLRSCTR
jgi:hypothetical protein